MALADFLGNVGSAMGGNPALSRELAMNELPMPGPITGFGGGTFGMDGQQVTPQMPQQAPPQAVERPGRKKGVRHFLGVLGDALLVGSGADPIYGPSVERAEMGEALAGYLGTTDAALADIMRRDPATGLALLKMKMESAPESQDPTALMQNMEYLRRLNPGMTDAQLAEVAQYAIAPPRMYGSPEMGWQPDPNYPFARGGSGGKVRVVSRKARSPTTPRRARVLSSGAGHGFRCKEAGVATPPAAFRSDYGSFKRAIIGQESGGRYGVPNAEGSGAMGIGQVMPETARALAQRLGMPYRPELMAGTSREARAYQDRITDAAVREAWDAGGGDLRTAAMYYHGGSNRDIWGPKTRRYANEVLGRLGGNR